MDKQILKKLYNDNLNTHSHRNYREYVYGSPEVRPLAPEELNKLVKHKWIQKVSYDLDDKLRELLAGPPPKKYFQKRAARRSYLCIFLSLIACKKGKENDGNVYDFGKPFNVNKTHYTTDVICPTTSYDAQSESASTSKAGYSKIEEAPLAVGESSSEEEELHDFEVTSDEDDEENESRLNDVATDAYENPTDIKKLIIPGRKLSALSITESVKKGTQYISDEADKPRVIIAIADAHENATDTKNLITPRRKLPALPIAKAVKRETKYISDEEDKPRVINASADRHEKVTDSKKLRAQRRKPTALPIAKSVERGARYISDEAEKPRAINATADVNENGTDTKNLITPRRKPSALPIIDSMRKGIKYIRNSINIDTPKSHSDDDNNCSPSFSLHTFNTNMRELIEKNSDSD